MKLLINEPLHPDRLNLLRREFAGVNIVAVADETAALSEIVEADALFGTITPALLQRAKKLRWIQAPLAGLEKYFFPELVASAVVVTNMRGIYNDHVADHAFAFVLAFARDLPKLMRSQLQKKWLPNEAVQTHYLNERTLGVIGLGGIGYEVARRAWVCGMRVLAVDPRRKDKPAEVAELWSMDGLDRLLAQSDFVVICAPHTPQTAGLIGAAQLAQMRPTAYLINIGRGAIVKLDALVDVLRQRRIAGAALDVYETEPLPAEHPLWDFDNVMLTPHVGAIVSETVFERRFQVLRENLRRFATGEPLCNVVDKQSWF